MHGTGSVAHGGSPHRRYRRVCHCPTVQSVATKTLVSTVSAGMVVLIA